MMRAFPAWAETAQVHGEPRKEGEMPLSTTLELPEQELGEEQWEEDDEEFGVEELNLDDYDDIDEDDDDGES
jgi:hypothetical protein